MEFGMRHLAVCLVASLAIGAQAAPQNESPPPQEQQQQEQQQQEQQQQQQPGQQQQQPEERPTLGPRTGPPSVSGPLTSTTTDVRKLLRIHTLYIETMDNALSDKLVETIGKWGRFRLVTKPKDADATLRGSCLESRRLRHVHSEVFISDRNGASIWQDNIYRPYNPPTLDQAVSDTATLVEAHLEESVREGERR